MKLKENEIKLINNSNKYNSSWKIKISLFITVFKNYFVFTLKKLRKTIESFWNSLILPKPEDSLKKMLVQSVTQFISALKSFEQEI